MKKVLIVGIVSLFCSVAFGQNEVTPIPLCTDPVPHTIFVSPSIAYVLYGGDVDFKATAYDAEGKRIEGFQPTSWSASAGNINDQGWYVANITGYHTVTAHYECLLSGTGSPNLVHLYIHGNASVHVGEERPR